MQQTCSALRHPSAAWSNRLRLGAACSALAASALGGAGEGQGKCQAQGGMCTLMPRAALPACHDHAPASLTGWLPADCCCCAACALLLPRPPVHRELQPYDEPTCRAVSYDFSGQYVAVGGSDLRVYSPKQVSQAPTDPHNFLPRLDHVCQHHWHSCRVTAQLRSWALGLSDWQAQAAWLRVDCMHARALRACLLHAPWPPPSDGLLSGLSISS